jgi:hypothetical protein
MLATHPENSPDHSISGNQAPVLRGGDVVDHGSKSLAVVALVAACLALGAVSMYVILAAQIVDAKIQAGSAKAETLANESRVNARVSLDEVERIRLQLASKGIYIPKADH